MNQKMFWAVTGLAALLASCGGSPPPQPEVKKADTGPAPDTSTSLLPAAGDPGGVRGKVTFIGTPPKPRPLSMDAQPVCAKMHKGPILAEDVVVGPNGELKNAFIWIKSGLAKRDYPLPKTAAKLDQVGCVYTPHVLGIMVKQPLEISNSDDTNHNIHPMPRINREWNESQPPKGEVKVKTFDQEEVPPILFKCNVHPWMRAWVAVVSHPYFAVSGADGAFSIENVPPGEYVLGAWHERFGTREANVRVDAKLIPTVNLSFKAEQ